MSRLWENVSLKKKKKNKKKVKIEDNPPLGAPRVWWGGGEGDMAPRWVPGPHIQFAPKNLNAGAQRPETVTLRSVAGPKSSSTVN